MSLEAQYSLLKGYEELLRKALLKGRKPALTHSLVRVLTPKRKIVSMRAMDSGENNFKFHFKKTIHIL